MTISNRDYYDRFASVYERHRHEGYHRLLDDLEMDVLRPYIAGNSVLEAGCGTGLLLRRVAPLARTAKGVDVSPAMLNVARSRGLDVAEADLCSLPFSDACFDTVYSFKVLPHVESIHEALLELERVTRPGGHLLLEFYNSRSLRGILKAIKPPTVIAPGLEDTHVYTRMDTLEDIKNFLPEMVQLKGIRGVRVVTPWAFLHSLPVVKTVLSHAERRCLDSPLSRFGGFVIIICRKNA